MSSAIDIIGTKTRLRECTDIVVANEETEIIVDFEYAIIGLGIVQFIPIIRGGIATGFDWDFGDGSEHSPEESPIHEYGS